MPKRFQAPTMQQARLIISHFSYDKDNERWVQKKKNLFIFLMPNRILSYTKIWKVSAEAPNLFERLYRTASYRIRRYERWEQCKKTCTICIAKLHPTPLSSKHKHHFRPLLFPPAITFFLRGKRKYRRFAAGKGSRKNARLKGNAVKSGDSTRCCDSRRASDNNVTAKFCASREGVRGER